MRGYLGFLFFFVIEDVTGGLIFFLRYILMIES